MTRRLAVELPKMLNVIHRNRRLIGYDVSIAIDISNSGQMQRRVQQHGSVPVRKHKSVAVGPQRIRRVVAQILLPQFIHHRRQPHRRPRMSGIGLLHGVNRQRTNGIDAELIHIQLTLRLTHWNSCAGETPPAALQQFLDAPPHAVGERFFSPNKNGSLIRGFRRIRARPYRQFASPPTQRIVGRFRNPLRAKDRRKGGGHQAIVYPRPVSILLR